MGQASARSDIGWFRIGLVLGLVCKVEFRTYWKLREAYTRVQGSRVALGGSQDFRGSVDHGLELV